MEGDVVMNVLSLFDGMSCGRIALDRAGFDVDQYYASELDKYAIQVTQANWSDTIQLGDVTKWREWDIDWSSIDLLIGGSPCQGFSFAGKQLAFDDPRSKLFFVYVDILNHIRSLNPEVKFMLENVKMKKEYLDVISEQLGVQPVFINSSLVSAQNRQRYYWANWDFGQPEDRGIVLADILEHDDVGSTPAAIRGRYIVDGKRQDGKMLTQQILEVKSDQKTNALTTVQKDNVVTLMKHGRYPLINLAESDGRDPEILINESATKNDKAYSLTASYNGAVAWNSIEKKQRTMIPYAESNEKAPNNYNGLSYRKLTPVECERLQTVPDNYTDCVSNTQRYKMLGNGWTVDVVVHIFKEMQKTEDVQ